MEPMRKATASPLTMAADAVLIDTTDMPIPQVVDRVMAMIKNRPS